MAQHSELINCITSPDPAVRDRSLDQFCREATLDQLMNECEALDHFRRQSDNLYERVRALFFLYAIHRFHLPQKLEGNANGLVPFEGYAHLLKRRFGEAIEIFLRAQKVHGPCDGVSSALAEAYHRLGFQTLADQVRHSVRSTLGNQWMFRCGHPDDYPLRVRQELRTQTDGLFPVLAESTPVRMDLTHSGWSDIFFLGMDFPEGARVINVSIDLVVKEPGAESAPSPPIETYFRVIDEPRLRLTSVDLNATAEILDFAEVFDFAKDYLGLLKAAVIASGIVPPGMEGADQPLSQLLDRLAGPGRGVEIVSNVRGIPKGSRLAVSTNLLASLIAVCMRATGQTGALDGVLSEPERRLVAARAIQGEWLGGSGGGWQDSGGVWPGIKLIKGVASGDGDPEFNVSRGRLLPDHEVFSTDEVTRQTRQKLQDSLVLVHGGMAQDVGPILEMVTEKYLLRSEVEWVARHEAMQVLDRMLTLLADGDVKAMGALTHHNFASPIQDIIPWAGNLYTEQLISRAQAEFGKDFWGFWMLGGMSGGGMGFIFDPRKKSRAQQRLQTIMSETKRQLQAAVPFAMEPVVYDFAINETGTHAAVRRGPDALMPPGYYHQKLPGLLRVDPAELTPTQRAELEGFGVACRAKQEYAGMELKLFDRLIPSAGDESTHVEGLEQLLAQHGFDQVTHNKIRADLQSGRIGLAQNRLPTRSQIEDVSAGDVFDATREANREHVELGAAAIADDRVAVVTMAGGTGSRWTQGAGVVKSINPFCKLAGRHRTFIEVHLAKSRLTGARHDALVPHVFTTSYLTHEPIKQYLAAESSYGYAGPLLLSPGRAVGLRMVPMGRDLRFAWQETAQQVLDEQAQKVQESLQKALIGWAETAGEGADYTDNLPSQCIHPVGHWYEVPNMFLNGVLAKLLRERPSLKYLMVHNIDTLGANLDPGVLGYHISEGATLTAEVITRRIEDRGGGLARVDGALRLVEGLALPYEEIEFDLTYYNSATIWAEVDGLLDAFGITRSDLDDEHKMIAAVRRMADRMPTYVTLKNVKKRWGQGQEDVLPVTQFEKLWGDMTALPEVASRFVAVPRVRGLQLKEPAQLDGWLRDGSADYLETICDWG